MEIYGRDKYDEKIDLTDLDQIVFRFGPGRRAEISLCLTRVNDRIEIFVYGPEGSDGPMFNQTWVEP